MVRLWKSEMNVNYSMFASYKALLRHTKKIWIEIFKKIICLPVNSRNLEDTIVMYKSLAKQHLFRCLSHDLLTQNLSGWWIHHQNEPDGLSILTCVQWRWPTHKEGFEALFFRLVHFISSRRKTDPSLRCTRVYERISVEVSHRGSLWD